MNAKLFSISLLTAGVLLASASPASASGYKFTDLDTLGGRYSIAYGINNSGQVVGYRDLSTGNIRATIWNGTTPTDLGEVGGVGISYAFGINNAGQVVGYAGGHATIWNGTTPTDLGTLGGNYSRAYGINNAGQVVGSAGSAGAGGYDHATIWNGTTPTDLGKAGRGLPIVGGVGDSTANAINDSGQVVGYAGGHAIIWNGTTPTVLGALGGNHSYAFGINNAGQVVGVASTFRDAASHATIWDGTALHTPTDLGTLGGNYSRALDINNSGQVVGYSYMSMSNGDGTHATLWNGTTPTDLNNYLSMSEHNAGWVLGVAIGINDNGWIVGNAYNPIARVYHPFLLTPCPTCTSYPYDYSVPVPIYAPIPEPEIYAMFMAGLGLMGFIARRRKNGQA